MIRLLLCTALALAGGCAAQAPTLGPFPEAAAAKTDPALVALYDAHRAGADLPTAPGLTVSDGAVLIEATAADGDGDGLERALGRVGLEEGSSSYGALVNGRLPIGALPAAAALEELRYLRPVIRPDRTPPTPPERL